MSYFIVDSEGIIVSGPYYSKEQAENDPYYTMSTGSEILCQEIK